MVDISTLVLRPLIQDIYNSARTGLRKRIKKYASDEFALELQKNISNIELVKTLYGRDEKQRIRDFYYPTKVEISGKRIVVDTVDGLLGKGVCLLTGTAGQGKSILARYLCINELERGKYIPIFIELRKYQGEDFESFVLEVFRDIGFNDISCEILECLIDGGRILLVLDGFDEVEKRNRDKIINGVERFRNRKNLERIIITSRPNTGIESSGYVEVVKLSPLSVVDINNLVFKLIKDEEFYSFIISALSTNHSVRSILITPLMVTLLCITYRVNEEIPNTMPEFYEKLFDTLVTKHDRNKQGFIRPREANLTDWEMQKIFEGLSFISLKNGKTRMVSRELNRFSEEALNGEGKECDLTTPFINDLVDITCLVVKDGYEEYEYVHKSIQEYFSSAFLDRQSDRKLIVFFGMCVENSGFYYHWLNVLNFYKEINFYKYMEMYFIPEFKRSIGEVEILNNWKGISIEELKNIFLNGGYICRYEFNGKNYGYVSSKWNTDYGISAIIQEMVGDTFSKYIQYSTETEEYLRGIEHITKDEFIRRKRKEKDNKSVNYLYKNSIEVMAFDMIDSKDWWLDFRSLVNSSVTRTVEPFRKEYNKYKLLKKQNEDTFLF